MTVDAHAPISTLVADVEAIAMFAFCNRIQIQISNKVSLRFTQPTSNFFFVAKNPKLFVSADCVKLVLVRFPNQGVSRFTRSPLKLWKPVKDDFFATRVFAPSMILSLDGVDPIRAIPKLSSVVIVLIRPKIVFVMMVIVWNGNVHVRVIAGHVTDFIDGHEAVVRAVGHVLIGTMMDSFCERLLVVVLSVVKRKVV